MVTKREEQELGILIASFRRNIRVLERAVQNISDDDVRRKFKGFVDRHKDCQDLLITFCEPEETGSNTPQEIIQFPETSGELLNLAAKSEKQLLEQIEAVLELELSDRVLPSLSNCKEIVAESYDYMEALSDLWV